MEKFTASADAYTGIHPFYPNPPVAKGIVPFIKLFLITPIIFLLRLPFIILFGGLLFAGDELVTLIPVSGVRRMLRRTVHFIFGGLLLLTLGVRVTTSYYPMRQRDTDKKRPGTSIRSGDLILSNHTSYLDILYFAYRYSPQFTTISSTGLNVAPATLYDAFKEAVTDIRPNIPNMPLSKLRKLAAINNWGPVLVFPEGTTTNGRIIIGPLSIMDVVPDPPHVNLISIRYPYNYHTPTYTGGSFLAHFFKLAGQIFNYMQVCHAMPDVIPTGANKDARGYLEDSMTIIATSAKLSQGRCLRDVKTQFWQKYYEK